MLDLKEVGPPNFNFAKVFCIHETFTAFIKKVGVSMIYYYIISV